MNILVTGAGGFIGSHLVDSQLARGFKVRAVDLHFDRLKHVEGHPNFQMVQGDITDDRLVKAITAGVEVVYHLASAHLDVSLSDERYRQVNVHATHAMLEAAREAGVKCFVHCSSVGVVGDVKHPPANETVICRPSNIYGKTKLEGERAALEFFQKTGFPVIVARPAWVYGPRCPRTEKLMRMLAKHRFIFFGKGSNLRHPVFISDAVEGLELCANAERAAGEIFNIAGDKPVQVRQLIAAMSEQIGVKTPTIHLPLFLGWGGGMALETVFKILGKRPPFSRRSLDFFLEDNAYDTGKARQMLGFQPKVDLGTGIRKTLDWNISKG